MILSRVRRRNKLWIRNSIDNTINYISFTGKCQDYLNFAVILAKNYFFFAKLSNLPSLNVTTTTIIVTTAA